MPRIVLKHLEIAARELLDRIRQLVEELPEAPSRSMLHLQVRQLARGILAQGFLDQEVELPGRGVLLDPKVPLLPVLLQEPVSQLGELFLRQVLDRRLELLNSGFLFCSSRVPRSRTLL